ncbi:transposase, undefined [Leifsonia xyli subsp. cynodontis DSM 46306]|uniref:Integrase catalytic domain-containing protein n=1 Tax=Leifsonia xyli subsp. cynodontis DSM 46306 TaxID=1389489 RepID=U3PG91_LEIXC|nr:transposase, undefined [Leifsonia xyli subsp. cynodontis DSM 46306]
MLHHLDQSTDLPVRKPKPTRYERQAPGQLVHVDIKKLGKIPAGGGWRKVGKQAGRRNSGKCGHGYAFLHHTVDDCTRLAYSEILEDERKETAAAFWVRARKFFNGHGIAVTAVMTDNGSCYQLQNVRRRTQDQVKHRRTRPYRPQTNGKAERFNHTLASEWAYAQTYESDAARAASYETWLHHYNHHRPHTGIAGSTPAERVHNVPGQHS